MPTPTSGVVKPISAARFILTTSTGNGQWAFQELSNINMEVEPHEFIYCEPDGTINHTKQYGKTNPPKVTLKKPMDDDTTLWGWHLACQAGSEAAKYIDCSLVAFKAGSPGLPPDQSKDKVFEWKLINAWPSKLDLSGMKAGSTETAVITVTFACDQIIIPAVKPDPAGGIPGGSKGT